MKKFWTDEGGAVATEYAVIVTVIALGIIAGAGVFMQGLNQWFSATGTAVSDVAPDPIQIPGSGI